MIVQSPLAFPFLAMLSLTALVWLMMFVRRIRYLQSAGIDAEEMRAPEDTARLLPPNVAAPGHNFKNLFEMPVLFYALCLYLMHLPQVDVFYVNAAWAFVVLRFVHSVVHCTYNRVMHRFLSYFMSSLILWAMLAYAVFQACG